MNLLLRRILATLGAGGALAGCSSAVGVLASRADDAAMDSVDADRAGDTGPTGDTVSTNDGSADAADAPTAHCAYPALGTVFSVPTGASGHAVGLGSASVDPDATLGSPRIVAERATLPEDRVRWAVAFATSEGDVYTRRVGTEDTEESPVDYFLPRSLFVRATGDTLRGIDALELVNGAAHMVLRTSATDDNLGYPDLTEHFFPVPGNDLLPGPLHWDLTPAGGTLRPHFTGQAAFGADRVVVPFAAQGLPYDLARRDLTGLSLAWQSAARVAPDVTRELGAGSPQGRPRVFAASGAARVWVAYNVSWDFPEIVEAREFDVATGTFTGVASPTLGNGTCPMDSYHVAVAPDRIAIVQDCTSGQTRLRIYGPSLAPRVDTVVTERRGAAFSRVAWNGESFGVAYTERDEGGPSLALFDPVGAPRSGRVQIAALPGGAGQTPVRLDIAGLPDANNAWGIAWEGYRAASPTNATAYLARLGRCGSNAPGRP